MRNTIHLVSALALFVMPITATSSYAGELDYIGKWAYKLSWCNNRPSDTDQVPINVTKGGIEGLENFCRFVRVSKRDNGWTIQTRCNGEGTTYNEKLLLSVQGNRLTQTSSRGKVTWIKCN